MNTVFLADFKRLLSEKELVNATGFWSQMMHTRLNINRKYAEKLLQWTCHMKKNIANMGEDAGVLSQHFHHFLDAYVSSTEMEAFNIIAVCQDIGVDGRPVQSLKKKVSPDLQTNLTRDLDELTRQHMECIKTLEHIKEEGMKVSASSGNYEDRLVELRADLAKMENRGKDHNRMKRKMKELETKMRRQKEKDKNQMLQFENMMREERSLVKRLRTTSEHACQEACDLQEGQMEALISVLRDLVLKADPLASDISDRTRPLLDILDHISDNRNNIINEDFNINCRSYIFPDVQDWHERFGLLDRIPMPFVQNSQRDIATDPRKALSPESIMTREFMAASGQTLPGRQQWTSKMSRHFGPVENSPKTNRQAPVLEQVKNMDDVYVRAIRSFKPTHPEHLKLKPGMLIKQKFPTDANGMCFGWSRKRLGGPKTFGFYPSDHVILDI